MEEDITVILTVYNRPEVLERQYNAIKKQSIPPKDIFIWINQGDNGRIDFDKFKEAKIIDSNHNWKFHGRFALALLARTTYVCIFDDDTIPGKKWFENCLTEMKKTPAIYGTAGIELYDFKNNVINPHGPAECLYNPHVKHGWNSTKTIPQHNTALPKEVDLVGHSWFFKQEWSKYMWYEEPVSWDNGEDIMFSYLCQKYGKIPTYVPPHPSDKPELWGSLEGSTLGNDENSSWRKSNHMTLRDKIVKECCKKGWRPCCAR